MTVAVAHLYLVSVGVPLAEHATLRDDSVAALLNLVLVNEQSLTKLPEQTIQLVVELVQNLVGNALKILDDPLSLALDLGELLAFEHEQVLAQFLADLRDIFLVKG